MAWSDIFQGIKDAIYSAQEKQEIEEKAQKKEKQIAASKSPVYSQGVSIEHGNGSRTAKPNAWESIAREAMDYLTAAQNQQSPVPSVAPARKLSEFTPFDDSRYMYDGSDSGDELTWRKLRVLDKDTGKESYMEVGYKDLFDGSPWKHEANALDSIGGIRFYDDDKINEYRDRANIDKAMRKHFNLDATRYTIYDTDKRWMDDSRGGPYGNGALTGGSVYDAVLFDTDDEEARGGGPYAGRFDPRVFSQWSIARRKEGLDEDLTDPTDPRLMENTYYSSMYAPEVTEEAKNGTMFAVNPWERDDYDTSDPGLFDEIQKYSDEELDTLRKYRSALEDYAALFVFEPNYERRTDYLSQLEQMIGKNGDGGTMNLVFVGMRPFFSHETADMTMEQRAEMARDFLKKLDTTLQIKRVNA